MSGGVMHANANGNGPEAVQPEPHDPALALQLSAASFFRRLCQHLPPSDYTRVRRDMLSRSCPSGQTFIHEALSTYPAFLAIGGSM